MPLSVLIMSVNVTNVVGDTFKLAKVKHPQPPPRRVHFMSRLRARFYFISDFGNRFLFLYIGQELLVPWAVKRG